MTSFVTSWYLATGDAITTIAYNFQIAVFHTRIGGHSPAWASDAKINLPRWKFTHPDEQIAFINITDENNNIYYLIVYLPGTNFLHH